MEEQTQANVKGITGQVCAAYDMLPAKELQVASEHLAAARVAIATLADGTEAEALQTVQAGLEKAEIHLATTQAAVGVAAVEVQAYVAEISGGAFDGDEALSNGVAATVRERLNSRRSFFESDHQGTVRPLDPLTGTVMYPGEMPPSLLADPEIQKGMAFWRSYGHEVAFRFLGTSHADETRMAQWGIDLRAEAERLAANNNVLFIEGNSTADVVHGAETLFKMAAVANPAKQSELIAALDNLAATRPNFGHYAEVAKQIMCTGVTTAIPDYIVGGNRPGDMVLTAWRRQKDALDLSDLPDGTPFNLALLERLALEMGIDMYRDMQFVGRMGAILAGRHVPGQITETAWVGGAMHENMGRHIAAHGASVSYAHDRTQFRPPQAVQVHMRHQGCITPATFKQFVASF